MGRVQQAREKELQAVCRFVEGADNDEVASVLSCVLQAYKLLVKHPSTPSFHTVSHLCTGGRLCLVLNEEEEI